MRTAQVRVVDQETLLSDSIKLHSLDLAKMKRSEQDFSATFEIKASRDSSRCTCIVLWFDTEFSSRFCSSSPQVLTTSPYSKPTHWAQTVLPLSEHVLIESEKNANRECIVAFKGRVSISRQEEMHRTLDISLEYAPVLKDGQVMTMKTQLYSIGVNENHS